MARPDLVEAGPQGLDLGQSKESEGQRLQLVAPFDFWLARSRPTARSRVRHRVFPGFGLA